VSLSVTVEGAVIVADFAADFTDVRLPALTLGVKRVAVILSIQGVF